MREILAKRLLFLTRIIVVIFFVSLVSLLYNLDANDLKSDVLLLSQINDIHDQIKKETITKNQDKITNNARVWLSEHDQNLWELNTQTRKSIRECLQENFPEFKETIIRMRKIENASQFNLIEILKIQEDLDYLDVKRKSSNVKEMLEKFNFITQPNKLSVAIGTINKNCPTKPEVIKIFKDADNLPSSSDEELILRGFRLSKINFQNGSLKLDFSLNTFASYFIDETIKINLRSEIVSNAPSILELITEEEPPTLTESQKNRLETVYGDIPFKQALEIASDNFLQSISNVELFGFTFSARRYPVVILLLSLFAETGIFLVIQTAWSRRLKIISGVSDEDVVDILIDNFIARTFLWCMLPIFSVFVSLPSYNLGLIDNLLLIFGLSIIFVLGLISTMRGRRL